MQNKSSNLLKLGTLFLIVTFCLLIFHFYLNKPSEIQIGSNEVKNEEKKEDKKALISPSNLQWQEYKNDKYRFKLRKPQYLYERVFENQGGYLFFVRFEETKFSVEKGLGLGVSDKSQDDEIENLKSSFKKDGAKLVKEEKIVVAGQNGIRLDFEPEKEGEKRAVVVFSKGNFTYSISSVPEQIERLVNSFEFLN